MDTVSFLSYLKSRPQFKDQFAHVEQIPYRQGEHGILQNPLHPTLQSLLGARGIRQLYCHQVKAIETVRAGGNIMVSTPSASGKTLCYNIPVLETLLADPLSRALYLFPTKALAQDQLRGLIELAGGEILTTGDMSTFDGDT
ncbi:MAG: DEAD/DEAH box helicase, partial [Dehalococcoidia bacterium]|nr:DEAD/DEAH box helicase [Dehalococcoidia bacterium]